MVSKPPKAPRSRELRTSSGEKTMSRSTDMLFGVNRRIFKELKKVSMAFFRVNRWKRWPVKRMMQQQQQKVYICKKRTNIVARVVVVKSLPSFVCQRVVTSDAHTSAAASGPARWREVDWRHAFRCWG